MRSFAVIAGLAAAANAYGYGYPETHNSTSVASTYPTSSKVAYSGYPAKSSAVYPGYPVASSKANEYPGYQASSKAPEYPAYTTTKVVYGVSTVCPKPTTVVYGVKTYIVASSTTLIDNDCTYTTTYVVKPTPAAYSAVPAGKSSAVPYVPAAYSSAPAAKPANATTGYPAAAKPSSTKPVTPEFTGAAAQAGVGLLAVIGAAAAFL